jgi:hypothetical protein
MIPALFYWIYQQLILLNVNTHAEEIIEQRSSADIPIPSNSDFVTSNWKSNRRGYVALLYSGTARSFSANFESHIVNLMAGCPYTVHLFFHTYTNDNRYPEHTTNSSYANYLSVNTTLAYFEGYINLDNEQVLFRDAVKANVFEHMPLKTLRQIYNDTYYISIRRFPGHPPIPSIYYMWHSQRRCEELRQKYIADTGIDYKWTFRIRHDAVYYVNWWQQAFNVQVYNSLNLLHKNIDHDVSGHWGVRRTRLYDMIYEPKLQMNNALYIPRGWTWLAGYNDQFAAMSSENAKHYFTRILHVDRMLREGRVHPETSIRLVAQWNNMTVNNVDGTICYDIVRTSLNVKQDTNHNDTITRSCSYKKSGVQDCEKLCPKFEKINQALHASFLHNTDFPSQNSAINVQQLKLLLMHHLSRINTDTIKIDYNASSFYYFYRYAHPIYTNDPCLPNTWTKDQSNIYATRYLPFVLRTSNQTKILIYNNHLACGSSIYR